MDEIELQVMERTEHEPFFLTDEPGLCASVPFSFEMTASFDPDGSAPSSRELLQLFRLIDASERFWEMFARRVVGDSDTSKMLVVGPSLVLAGASNVSVLANAKPRPSFGVLYPLSSGEDFVKTLPQVFALAGEGAGLIGIPLLDERSSYTVARAIRSPTSSLFELLRLIASDKSPPEALLYSRRKHVSFEFRLNECEFWVGSAKSRGTGNVTLSVAGVILGLAGLLGAQKSVEEVYARADISERIAELTGSPCYIRGEINLDRSDLIKKGAALLRRQDRVGICARQEMLVALGIYPGPVDGIEGPETLSALATFRSMWHLQPGHETNQVYDYAFAAAAINAMGGKKPGG